MMAPNIVYGLLQPIADYEKTMHLADSNFRTTVLTGRQKQSIWWVSKFLEGMFICSRRDGSCLASIGIFCAASSSIEHRARCDVGSSNSLTASTAAGLHLVAARKVDLGS
jgi:hypothetical protein